MQLMSKRSLRRLLLSGAYMIGIFGIVASGGGGGGGSTVSFPTPTLPAGAIVIDAMNATDVATSAVLFTNTVSGGALKTEAPPSVLEIAKQAADLLVKRVRELSSVATGVTEDLSFDFCINAPPGSAIINYTETANSLLGTITFTNCEFFTDVFVGGNFAISFSYDEVTEDYSQQLGGTLVITVSGIPATVVSNATESGNDMTGAFSTSVSFSITGIPEGPYLVTTAQPLMGNFISITSGELIVTGGVGVGPGNTRLRLLVIPGDMVEISRDAGDGTFVPHGVISF
jgi:hypothetical protein